MNDVVGAPVHRLAKALRSGSVSALEVADAFLQRVADLDDQIGAFCAIEPELVRRDAKLADAHLARGEDPGPLHGVPIAVKDLIFTRSLPTTGGSPIYEDFVPDEDDVVIERLRGAGAIIFGKTNTAEFGFSGNQTDNLLFGPTRNPWNFDRTPGGSSGGSAAAVAADLVPAAIGSDGGGSIRIPSAFCGVFGIKPTFGRVPLYPGCRDTRYPGFSAWESLEHIGPITWGPRDAALILGAIAGVDLRDRHSLPCDNTGLASLAAADCGKLRIAWSPDWGGTEAVDSAVRVAVAAVAQRFADAGALVVQDEPARPMSVEEFGAIVALDADPEGMRDLIAKHPGTVGDRIQQIVAGDWSLLELGSALSARRALYLAVERFFSRYDLFLTPTVPLGAFPLGWQGPELIDGTIPDDRARAILGFCFPFNVTGHPAASMPCGFDEAGMPIGVQLVAGRLRDSTVLGAALAYEQAAPWGDRRPQLLAPTSRAGTA